MIRVKERPETKADRWVAAKHSNRSRKARFFRKTRKSELYSQTKENKCLVSFMPGENWERRHSRREAYNNANLPRVQEWARQNGIRMRVTESGTWKFYCGSREATYVPGNANLWVRGIRHHLHDYVSVIDTIEKEWGIRN